MSIRYEIGIFKVIKDGNWYRVLKGRKRVGSYKLLCDAIDYADLRHNTLAILEGEK
jgi:hypothetical protein